MARLCKGTCQQWCPQLPHLTRERYFLARTRPPTPIPLTCACAACLGVVLDACGGRGTIPVEAGKPSGKQTAGCAWGYGIAGECDPETLASLGATMERHRNARVDGLAWDACALPVRSSSVDSYVSDLPFGLRCLNAAKLKKLYPKLVTEAERVVVPGTGVLVWYVPHSLMHTHARAHTHTRTHTNAHMHTRPHKHTHTHTRTHAHTNTQTHTQTHIHAHTHTHTYTHTHTHTVRVVGLVTERHCTQSLMDLTSAQACSYQL